MPKTLEQFSFLEKKYLIEKSWNLLWESGITNPIDISKVFAELFLNNHKKNNSSFINELSKDKSSKFAIQKVSEYSELLNKNNGDDDLLGDIYEQILSKLSLAGHYGQFRTPSHLIDFIYEVFPPREGETVLDPACGTAGFLINANKKCKNLILKGFEIDRSIFEIARSNVTLHKLKDNFIFRGSGLVEERIKADYIATNPPFSGKINQTFESASLKIRTKKTELAFLLNCIDQLKENGRCSIILPIGVASNTNKEFVSVRKKLIEVTDIEAIVEMPRGCFLPYTSVKTVILFFRKCKYGTQKFLSCICNNDGYSLDDARIKLKSSDLKIIADSIIKKNLIAKNKFVKFIDIKEIDEFYRFNPSRFNHSDDFYDSDNKFKRDYIKGDITRSIASNLENIESSLNIMKKLLLTLGKSL